MLNFIKNFLSDRTFQVKVNGHLSQVFKQENGVPQGSTLSVSLFLVAINDLCEEIKFPVKSSLFADDLNIWCCGKNTQNIQPVLQDALLSLEKWSSKSGYRFSAPKSQSIIFTLQKKYQTLNIKINNTPIHNTRLLKILGIVFDTRNNWCAHLKELRKTTITRINILKMLAHTSWGANSSSLKMIYKSIILSKLEYGSFLFINASSSNLKMIETVHNSGLRLVSGAFRSSPIPSLLNITQTPPICLIRKKNAMLLAARRTQNNLPIHQGIENLLQNTNIDISGIIRHEGPLTPPWIMDFNINTTLSSLPKTDTLPSIYRKEFLSISENHQEHTKFFTDGSKTNLGVGAAVVYNETKQMFKLPDFCSVFTAEATAISLALDIIYENRMNKAIIFSDSLSTLTSILNIHQPNSISGKIHNQIHRLKSNTQTIIFCWVPSHVGIRGNELADTFAKEAISSHLSRQIHTCTFQDLKTTIDNHILAQWQILWSTLHTKLNKIKPTVSPWPSFLLPRRQEVILNRLRIGHTWVTHKHLMDRSEPEQCQTCGETSTVEHIICHCRKFADIRINLNISDNLEEALSPQSINIKQIINFLKLTGLYHLI
ncbi:uncharacterized protein LOC132942682 [Metopolophium dirhodum]|uniref:uncharacterized protein LOC132942682 n=1 Tax=Metopolophium dirhodum TaxID=44670 RepID=UPI00298F8D06|nr:uncharacterized protein LOC132942682 [Metopolophium dirhodum]